MKSPTTYSQEDLDLINSQIPNLDCSIPTTSSEDPAQRPSSNTDTYYPNVEEFPSNLNINDLQNAYSLDLIKEVSAAEGSEFIQNENVAIPVQAVSEYVSPPVIIDDVTNNFHPGIENIRLQSERNVDKASELKIKSVNRRGLNFYPGDKLEAKDFNEKWYSARVVETDWIEREVLIHFDKWSSRFDEWIPMDSPRLRMLQVQSREMKTRDFVAGERILATWADGRKYPAKVNAVLGNDRYDVLFDDGYAKIVRSSKMTKIGGPLDEKLDGEDFIGSKEKRKDRNRKYQVMDLFQRKSKKLNTEKHPKKGRPSKEEGPSEALADSGSLSGSHDDSGTEVLHGFDNSTPKMKTYLKKDKKDRTDATPEESVRPEWIDGEPQGIESFIEGPRRSIIVADKRLPPGWQKHFTQRKAGSSAGKWDVLFIHESSGKKFRSRNDIRSFMETQGMLDFDPEKFDFCIHRKKKSKLDKPKSETDPVRKPRYSRSRHVVVPEYSPAPGFSTPTSSITPSSSVDDGAVFIGDLRIEMEDSSYKCPKEGCLKNFRKENLLQMHIKHYHPEYSKYLGSTPLVADLAYARTTRTSNSDAVPKQIPSFMEKINKLERRKGSHDKSQLPVLHSALSPSQLSTSMPSPTPPVLEVEVGRPEDLSNYHRDEKVESSPIRGNSESTRQDNDCAMSPGTLFDLKLREEKTQTGIKTLLPVRPAASDEGSDRSKSLIEVTPKERGRSQRKRHLSEYHSDTVGRAKKKQRPQDHSDNFDDVPHNTMDSEGRPTTYRFSRRKQDVSKHGDMSKNKGGETSLLINGEMVKVEQLRKEEIINCICKEVEEDGLMIQCDLCLCWQHGHCNAIEREKDVPDKYVCLICRHPYRQRPSKKYIHDHEWMKNGKLPSLSDRTKNEFTIQQRTAMLKRSYDLVSSLLQVQTLLHSLRVKINVAHKKDHPKLYLWAKNWEKFVIPKPDITPVPVFEVIEQAEELESKADNEEIKFEDQTIKKDPDDKSIATDSELVKILEEGGTHSEDSKVVNKIEDSGSQSEDHFLLDALTKSSCLEENLKTETSNEILELSQDIKKSTSVETEPSILSESDVSAPPEFSSSSTKRLAAVPLVPFIPEPEAPIDPTECRMRLLEHIDHFESYISSRLTAIEAQVQVLEKMDPDSMPELESTPRTKQTVQMLLRDLSTIRKLAKLC